MKESFKNIFSRREFLAGTGVVLLTGLLGGCKSGGAVVTTTKTVTESGELSGTISIGGSTTVQPVSETLSNAFMEIFPQTTVTITGGGSSVGVKSAADGTLDIGAASRELKESEESLGLELHVLAYDGIAVVTNASQTVKELSLEQIKQIFAGEITNWNELGGANGNIVVVAREEGSGTRGAFEEMVMGEDTLITDGAILQSSNGALKTTVAGSNNAIGFISFGYLDSSVNAIIINGVEATVENAKNGTYPIVRPLLYLTKGEPGGLVKKYIDFCQGIAGQAIVAEDYISIL